MTPTIGLITSQPISNLVKELEPELLNHCTLIHLVADGADKVLDLYTENISKVDLFVFSGRILYYILSKQNIFPEKPFFILNEFEGDLKGILLKQIFANRNFDVSRVFVDTAFPHNNYMELKEICPQDQQPYMTELSDIEDPLTVGSKILERGITLFNESKIDLIITGFGTNVEKLKKLKIPHVYHYPSKEYVLNFFMQIVATESKKDYYIPAVISIESKIQSEENIAGCIRNLGEITRVRGFDFTIQRQGVTLLILTQLSELWILTEEFKTDTFRRDLEQGTGALVIGLGSGNNFFQAKLNARIAMDTGRNSKGGTYYSSNENELIGPLGSNHFASYKSKPDEELIKLSAKYHLDNKNLQKIVSFTQINGSEKFTAAQLSDFLGVTVRSASRLMNKVVENGGATTYSEHIKGGRGRPEKYYNLKLIGDEH